MGDIKLAKIDDFMDEIDLEQPVIDKSREIEQIYSLGKKSFNKLFAFLVESYYFIPTLRLYMFRRN